MTDFALARRNMIDGQLRPNRVTNAQLLAAIGELPRERFLPEATRSVAYADDDVPLGNGRYLMEPMVLARLIQTLQSRPEDRALVVASGTGYGAALLARLVHSVVAVESDPTLAAAADRTAKELGISGIRQTIGKPEQGCAEQAPYDVILIEGAVQLVPQAIFDQLAEGGRLTTVIAGPAGASGVAQLFMKEGGLASGRPLFDSGTPSLLGFDAPPRFTF
ncbi:MAG TPA: protein-L-isoaspartate O-methyltransferase [Reyranella sp.]|jgi:protein-L-isoaspartate(D-aspartate) O-methyltransferase|nr:protein-L-isoaspartate O-methyltransferase [Reyranella sp.]